ncbi:GAF domain-containing protein [Haloparvum sp. PAK95]|uniref:sensor histidine kinase n=1 Tax=Haloparvum sp. PAK95 TaxID=3418962 RepID=UPI003D2E9EEC
MGTSEIRVLHVDDEGSITEITAEFLERENERFTVETAPNGADGLEALEANEYDCVVSDYDMPGMDGIEFLEAVRERYPNLPFILYTGKGSEEVASEAIVEGASDYIQKESGTSQYAVLANRIENAVGKYRAERDVEATRTRYQRLIEESTDVILVVDDAGNFEYLSPAAERVLDYSSDEMTGNYAFDYVHEADQDEAMARFSDLVRTPGGHESVEFRFKAGDGSWRWLEARGRNLLDDPIIEGIVVYARDITSRREREETLKELIQRTGDLIEATSKAETAEVAIDVVGDVLDAPLAGFHLLSDDRQRLEPVATLDEVRSELGDPPTYDRSDESPTSAIVWDAFEDGEPVHIDRVESVDELADATPVRTGCIYPLGDHGVFIVSEMEPNAFDEVDRKFLELLGRTVRAALDRVERESVLRERNRRLERLHETGRELMQADSTEEIAERVAAASGAILGFPITVVRYHDEETNRLVPVATTDEVTDLLGPRPAFGPEETSTTWEAYQEGSPVIYDDVDDVDHAADPETPLRSFMIVPIGEHGTVSFGTTAPGSFDDNDVFLARLLGTTTELALSRLKHEQELVRQRDELDRQNERLDQFASTLSHDLRNPLNVAMGQLDLARGERDSEHLDAVARAHERMESLIEDVLSLARAETELAELESVDLAVLTEGCWQTVESGSAELRVETDLVVRADDARLRQLMENLLRNSVEHGAGSSPSSGDGEVTITVGDLEDGFYVEDDGPGIPADEREAIFESGYSSTTGGSGLGLNIVKQVAEAHGWEVTVTDGTDGGARFEFRGMESQQASAG